MTNIFLVSVIETWFIGLNARRCGVAFKIVYNVTVSIIGFGCGEFMTVDVEIRKIRVF